MDENDREANNLIDDYEQKYGFPICWSKEVEIEFYQKFNKIYRNKKYYCKRQGKRNEVQN